MSGRARGSLLLGLLMACAIAFPAAAMATVNPTVTVTQPTGNAAGSTGSAQIAVAFNQSVGDAVNTVSINLAPGLLLPYNLDGGACVTVATPAPACQIGSGTATIAGTDTPMALYLTAPPTSFDLAGVVLVAGTTTVDGAVDLVSGVSLDPLGAITREAINLTGLPAAPVSALNLTLTGLRLPTACPSVPGQIAVYSTSQLSTTPVIRDASFPVTGCGSLTYLPLVSNVIHRDPGTTGTASLTTKIGQFGNQSSTASATLGLPTAAVTVNSALEPCVTGSTCTVGSATIVSPLLPAGSLDQGTITLSGTRRAPQITVSFPPPTSISFSGTVSFLASTLTLDDLPDIPINSLTMRFTGNQLGRLYTTNCDPTMVGSKLLGASGGKAVSGKTAVKYTGCPLKHTGPPTVTGGWLKGLSTGHPVVHLKAFRGQYAASLRTVAVSLPSGLSFDSSTADPFVCYSRSTCTSVLSGHGLTVLNAKVKSITAHPGQLILTFAQPTRSVSIEAAAPLVTESRSLAARVKSGAVHRLTIGVAVTSASGKHALLHLRPVAR